MSVGTSGYGPFYSHTSVIAVKAVCPRSRQEEAGLKLASVLLTFHSLIYQVASKNCLPWARKVPCLPCSPKEQWMNWHTKKGRGIADIGHGAWDTYRGSRPSGRPQRRTWQPLTLRPMQTGFEVDSVAEPQAGDLGLPLPQFHLLSITTLLTQRLPSPDTLALPMVHLKALPRRLCLWDSPNLWSPLCTYHFLILKMFLRLWLPLNSSYRHPSGHWDCPVSSPAPFLPGHLVCCRPLHS